MSYILDALKKSEQERRRGEMPEINRFESDTPQSEVKHKWWPIVAVVLVLVNLVLLVVWAPWESQTTPVANQTVAPNQPQSTVSQSSPPSPDNSGSGIKVKPAPEAPVTPRQPASIPQPAKVMPARKEVAKTAAKPSPAVMEPETLEPELITPSTQSAPSRSAPPRASYLPQLQELPANVQQRIPDLSFSSHMYSSEPRFRSIIINGRRLKEGQYLNDEIQVREITDKGVVLGMGDTLFEVDVLGQWVN